MILSPFSLVFFLQNRSFTDIPNREPAALCLKISLSYISEVRRVGLSLQPWLSCFNLLLLMNCSYFRGVHILLHPPQRRAAFSSIVVGEEVWCHRPTWFLPCPSLPARFTCETLGKKTGLVFDDHMLFSSDKRHQAHRSFQKVTVACFFGFFSLSLKCPLRQTFLKRCHVTV